MEDISWKLIPCREFNGAKDKDGYGIISEKTYGTHYYHRYIWMLHNGPIPTETYVLHRCDNPSCVEIAHLFIGTQRDNMRDSINKGRFNHAKGERVNTAKLTELDVLKIRRLRRRYTHRQLAEKFGVNQSTITRVLSRKTWRHI